jgi:hypothetical protein
METVFQIIGVWLWLPYLLDDFDNNNNSNNNNNNNSSNNNNSNNNNSNNNSNSNNSIINNNSNSNNNIYLLNPNKYIINTTNIPLLAIFVTVISIYSRPTGVLWWLPLGVTWLYLQKINTTNLNFIIIIIKCLIIGIILILIFIGIDSYFYYIATNIEVIKIDFEKISNMDFISIWNYFKPYIVFTPFNFFNVNIILNYASLFGEKQWYWTVVEGLPVMLGDK